VHKEQHQKEERTHTIVMDVKTKREVTVGDQKVTFN